METKKCSRCKKTKLISAFGKNSSSKSGLQNYCRECRRQYYQDHCEVLKARSQKYHQTHRKAMLIYKQEHYQNHRDYYRKHRQDLYKKDRDAWIDILEKYKLTRCNKCGYNKCFAAIDYHHTDPKSKEYAVADLLRIKPTVDKITKLLDDTTNGVIMPLCANCHRELHNEYRMGEGK